MMKLIKKLLNMSDNNNSTIENQVMITKEFPLFDFSHFSNHTMIDVVMMPKATDNDKIKLYIPESLVDLLELEMEDHFKIKYKDNLKMINLTLNQKESPRIEIPLNNLNLKTILNDSMGFLKVKECVTIEEKIINNSSGKVSVHIFTGNVIKNESMGKIIIKNINANNLKLVSNGSGNLEIINGSIDHLKSDTNSMGSVTVNANILSAKISSSGSGNTEIDNVIEEVNIDLTSMGNVSVKGSCTERLMISSSGSGKVTVENVDTQYLNINLTSMGNVEIVGQSVESKVKSSGSGNVKGNFSSSVADINMSSMGNVNIKPSNKLIAKINGMGNLNLSGNAVLESVEAQLNSMGKLKGGNVTTRNLSITGKSNQCEIETFSSKRNRL